MKKYFYIAGIIGAAIIGWIIRIDNLQSVLDPHIDIEAYFLRDLGRISDKDADAMTPKVTKGSHLVGIFYKAEKRGVFPAGNIEIRDTPKFGKLREKVGKWKKVNNKTLFKDGLITTFPARPQDEITGVFNGEQECFVTLELRYNTFLPTKEFESLKKYQYIFNTPKGEPEFKRNE